MGGRPVAATLRWGPRPSFPRALPQLHGATSAKVEATGRPTLNDQPGGGCSVKAWIAPLNSGRF